MSIEPIPQQPCRPALKRRIFYIDVGNLPKKEAEAYVRGLMSKNHSDRQLVEFLENLALMLAAAWSLGFLVLICYVLLTNDPKGIP